MRKTSALAVKVVRRTDVAKASSNENDATNVRSTKSPVSAASDVRNSTIVYCSGSCSGNGSSNAVADIGVWWGEEDSRFVALTRTFSKDTEAWLYR